MRCGSSTCLNGEINAVRCGAGILHAYIGKSMRYGFSTSLYREINSVRCGAVSPHTYMGNRPNLLPEMHSTIVYTEIIGDNNYYRYFGSGDSTMRGVSRITNVRSALHSVKLF
jgi:hypothetical protein